LSNNIYLYKYLLTFKKIIMRKVFTLIIITIFGIGIVNAQNQPLNAGLESWVTSDPGQLPEFWDGTNLNMLIRFFPQANSIYKKQQLS
jgi:hypothetical protein